MTHQGPTENDSTRRMAGWMIIIMWLIMLGLGVMAAQQWLDKRAETRRAQVEFNELGNQQLRLPADRFGQFSLIGSVNGEPVTFLLDTGASGISIPSGIAQRLGLEEGRPFQVVTANGTITVYRTRLESLAIGPFSRREVTAHINPSMDAEVALLGMSFLRQFELLQREGELIIRLPGSGSG